MHPAVHCFARTAGINDVAHTQIIGAKEFSVNHAEEFGPPRQLSFSAELWTAARRERCEGGRSRPACAAARRLRPPSHRSRRAAVQSSALNDSCRGGPNSSAWLTENSFAPIICV